MNRRTLLKSALGLPVATALPAAAHAVQTRRTLIQESPVAGTQFYAFEQIHPALRVDDVLILRRNPFNKYDRRAVEVWWGEFMLGHLPRDENAAVSQMMDRGAKLVARLVACRTSKSPWERVRASVSLREYA